MTIIQSILSVKISQRKEMTPPPDRKTRRTYNDSPCIVPWQYNDLDCFDPSEASIDCQSMHHSASWDNVMFGQLDTIMSHTFQDAFTAIHGCQLKLNIACIRGLKPTSFWTHVSQIETTFCKPNPVKHQQQGQITAWTSLSIIVERTWTNSRPQKSQNWWRKTARNPRYLNGIFPQTMDVTFPGYDIAQVREHAQLECLGLANLWHGKWWPSWQIRYGMAWYGIWMYMDVYIYICIYIYINSMDSFCLQDIKTLWLQPYWSLTTSFARNGPSEEATPQRHKGKEERWE